MAKKSDLTDWVIEALRERGGTAHHVQIAKYIWDHYEAELRDSGDLFYTWQYDLRWAGKKLRDRGILRPDDDTERGVWALM
jgi:hypothetical protein